MSAQRQPEPRPPMLLEIPPLPDGATPKERDVFRVEQQLALTAYRMRLVVTGDGRVSSRDAAVLILHGRHDGDAQLRKWRWEGTGPKFSGNGSRVYYSLHALAVWLVEQERDPNA